MRYVSATSIGLFEQTAPHYGEIWYDLGGRTAMSRVTTAEGVLETIYALAGVAPPAEDERRRSSAAIRSRCRPRARRRVLRHLAGARRRPAAFVRSEEARDERHVAAGCRRRRRAACSRRSCAADIKVDLSKETVGKPPATFEPMVGTWVVAQDGADKVIMVDGRPWVASKDNPTKLLDRERAQAVRHDRTKS